MRNLVTIGHLGAATPLSRSRLRRVAYLHRVPMHGIGQTNPNFHPGATSDNAGNALQDSALSLLNYLDVSGAPSEHASDQQVEDFQLVWNEDPANAAASAKLSVDGGYGPNTRDALNAIVGGIAPAVNTGGAPAPSPAPHPSPTPGPGPAPPVQQAGMGGGGLLLLLAIAAAAGYAIFGKKKRLTSVIVRRNPRRGGRRAYL
jgi:hypothetical protein